MIRSICVFCGANSGNRAEYSEAARELATLLVHKGIQLVYGAGSVGLMGVLADETLAQGGRVIGVIPEHLCSKEILHDNLTECHVTASLLERKLLMMELSDGFIALPGGLGTFDEILEIQTWVQLGRHAKPLGLINTCGYFYPFLASLDHAVAEGFLRKDQRAKIHISARPASLLEEILTSIR